MAKKNTPLKKPKSKQETDTEKLQRLSDTYQWAAASKSYNSPSGSTRSNTSGKAFMEQQNKMLSATAGRADVSTYSIAINKKNRMLLDAGQTIAPIGTLRGLPFNDNPVVKKAAKPKTNKK